MSARSLASHDAEREGVRIGVFICHCGGNISDVVDVNALRESASKQDGVVAATDFRFMCSNQGQARLQEMIKEKGLDAFADATEELARRGLAHRRLIVGEGPERARLAARLPDAIFTGHLEGADLARAALSLAGAAPAKGRGVRERLRMEGGELMLIDESYNASPTSMRAMALRRSDSAGSASRKKRRRPSPAGISSMRCGHTPSSRAQTPAIAASSSSPVPSARERGTLTRRRTSDRRRPRR